VGALGAVSLFDHRGAAREPSGGGSAHRGALGACAKALPAPNRPRALGDVWVLDARDVVAQGAKRGRSGEGARAKGAPGFGWEPSAEPRAHRRDRGALPGELPLDRAAALRQSGGTRRGPPCARPASDLSDGTQGDAGTGLGAPAPPPSGADRRPNASRRAAGEARGP